MSTKTKVTLNNTKLLNKYKHKSEFWQYIKYKHLVLMFIIPVIYFVIFKYGPMYGIVIAFQKYYPLKGVAGSEWVGFDNFLDLFRGYYFLRVFKNTLLISLYKLLWGFPAPILLAICINEVTNLRYKKIVQTISYLPHFLSWVVLAGIFLEFFSPSRGPINVLLQMLGIDPIFFFAEKSWFRTLLVSTGIWQGIGWGSIVYIAAISNIDPQLYEVAEIDGAGRLRKIWDITIPSIAPVIVIMFIFACGSLINDNFQQVYNFLNPKVLEVGDVISTYTYREGLEKMNYSYSTAVGLFKNIISFGLVMTANYIARKTSEYALW